MEKGDQLFLQIRPHVDQQVAATHQVQPGERRVFDDIVLREHQQVADALVHAVGVAIRLQREKARQPVRRNVRRNAGRVQPGAGAGNGAAVHIRREHLQLVAGLEHLQPLLQQHGDGIGFFAGGAARRPHTHRATRGFIVKQLGYDLRGQHFKGLGVAEEIGHANQEIMKQRLHFPRRLLQKLDVAVNRLDLVHRHAPLNPAVDGAGLVLREIVAGLRAHQDEYLLQRIFGVRHAGVAAFGVGQRRLAKGMGHVGHQLVRHLGRGQLKVHQTGRQ